MKKVLLIALVGLILFSGCVTTPPIKEYVCEDGSVVSKPEDCKKEETKLANFLTYENNEMGIRIKYPEDWKVLNGTGNMVRFVTPNTSDTPGELQNLDSVMFGILIDDYFAQPSITLEEYKEEIQSRFKENYNATELKLIESKSITLAGEPAFKFIHTFKISEVYSMKMVSVFTVKKDKGYFINIAAKEEVYSNYSETIDKMIESFEIFDAQIKDRCSQTGGQLLIKDFKIYSDKIELIIQNGTPDTIILNGFSGEPTQITWNNPEDNILQRADTGIFVIKGNFPETIKEEITISYSSGGLTKTEKTTCRALIE